MKKNNPTKKLDNLKTVIIQAQKGDQIAFNTLVYHFQDMAVGYAYSILGDFHFAEDAAQEAFISTHLKFQQLKNPHSFTGWFRSIVFSQCMRLIRSKRGETRSLPQTEQTASPEPKPDEHLEQNEIKELISQAIQSLPTSEREAMVLFYISEYAQAEIAHFLDVPIYTIKNRLKSARKKLKVQLMDIFQETLYEKRPSKNQVFQNSVQSIVDLAYEEDLNSAEISWDKDVTTHWVLPEKLQGEAVIVARKSGVIAGLGVTRSVFQKIDAGIIFEPSVEEGIVVAANTEIARVHGSARAILMGERTALNFLQHLSGVATLTRTYVNAVSDTDVCISDTRKTLPGLRMHERRAVRLGGGVNHRFGLYDVILITKNHAACVGGLENAVQAVLQHKKAEVRIMIEVASIEDIQKVLPYDIDRIMLDNMSIKAMKEAVGIIRNKNPNIEIEATGNIDLKQVRKVALLGVDFISIGRITHSAPSLDLSLLFAPK